MSDQPSSPPPKADKKDHGEGFFDRPSTHQLIFYVLLGICFLLLLVDPLVDKHPHFEFEAWPGFHAGYGFFAYMAIVTGAKGLRLLIKREEDYYGE